MSSTISALRIIAAKHTSSAAKTTPAETKQLDAEGLWVNAFRAHALLLKTLCHAHHIDGLSPAEPPKYWEMDKITAALSTLPEVVLKEIAVIGAASVAKLRTNANVMQDQGVIEDAETIVALFMVACDYSIPTAPVADIGVV